MAGDSNGVVSPVAPVGGAPPGGSAPRAGSWAHSQGHVQPELHWGEALRRLHPCTSASGWGLAGLPSPAGDHTSSHAVIGIGGAKAEASAFLKM